MLLNLLELINKYNLNINNIIHIGAHTGEEHISYIQVNVSKVIYFEPLEWCYTRLYHHIANLNVQYPNKIETIIYPIALGNNQCMIDINISKHKTVDCAFGASSSILKPNKHLELHPDIIFKDVQKVSMNKLDNINISTNYNFINIDVQGYELEVFKGAKNTLNNIDYIMTEVNIDEVYENCAKIEELDDFLSKYRFKRVETCMGGRLWGDAFYIKDNK